MTLLGKEALPSTADAGALIIVPLTASLVVSTGSDWAADMKGIDAGARTHAVETKPAQTARAAKATRHCLKEIIEGLKRKVACNSLFLLADLYLHISS